MQLRNWWMLPACLALTSCEALTAATKGLTSVTDATKGVTDAADKAKGQVDDAKGKADAAKAGGQTGAKDKDGQPNGDGKGGCIDPDVALDSCTSTVADVVAAEG